MFEMSVENQPTALLVDSFVELSLSKDSESEKEKLKDKNSNLASIAPSKPNHVFDISSLVLSCVIFFFEVIHYVDKLLWIFLKIYFII